MKKKLFTKCGSMAHSMAAMALVALSLATAPAAAQIAAGGTETAPSRPAPGTVVRDGKKITSYTASTGKTYRVGDTIRLGVAKRMDNAYFTITTSFNKKHLGDNGEHMPGRYAGQQFIIEGMDNGGGLFEGRTMSSPMYFYIKVSGLFGGLYQINVEPALMQQEFQ